MSDQPESAIPPGSEAAGSHDVLAERGESVPSIAIFAQRRKELGLSYDDVANQLKFAPRLVEALEAGEFDKLPGRTFARGMLRTYAKLLKIDPAPFLAQLGNTPTAPVIASGQAVSLSAPVPFAESSGHNRMYVALSCCVLAAAAYFAADWYFDKDSPSNMAFVTPGNPAPPAASPATPAASPAPADTATPAAAAPAPAAPATPATTVASAGATPLPETTPRPDAATTETRPPLPPGKGRIVIKFDKESWVEIKGKNGTLLSQLNPAGSEKTIEGDPPFHLTIGNAPSVHVTYNDQPVDLKPHFKVDVARLTLN